MARVDLIDYHEREQYPSHSRAIAGIVIVFGGFLAIGAYSLMDLWSQYGTDIMNAIQGIGLPAFLTSNAFAVAGIVVGMILLSLLLAFGASLAARRLGGTLIYIGAVFMNIMSWLGVLVIWGLAGFDFAVLTASWPIMIPGFFTLFMTLLLFTVFRSRVRRAGEIVKLTGQVCLDEKGVFVPQLLTMIFTLVSALMFGAIIFRFVPLEVVFFFYNFAYGTTSGIVYIYMRGRDPGLGDGVKASLGVIGGLIALSIMSVIVTIVRIIIQSVARKSGGAGRFVGYTASGVIGWIWAIINYFTIPAMVAEELGAKDGIKRSAGLVKNNFVDVLIKETAVRWAFGVLALSFFIAFAFGGAVVGWLLTGDLILTLIIAVLFTVFASIPSSLVLRTFDIVYVTLLYVFIRRKEGDITGKTVIPESMERELDQAYDIARSRELE
ncbi:MAG: DUF6159 family protein [Candidatus Thorarchaeota archaeon]